MQLNLLKEGISTFSEFLASRPRLEHEYKYEIFETFRQAWNYNTDDFVAMYDSALQSKVTRRWWKRDSYRPKETMLLLMMMDTDFARHAFRDLFDLAKGLDGRIDRFQFYSSELLSIYRQKNRREIINNHYQDAQIISLYLGAIYPDRYTLYPGRRIFKEFLSHLAAKELGTVDDLPRFMKVCRLVQKIMNENQVLLDFLKNDFRGTENLLIVHEFIYYTVQRWQENIP